MESLADRFAKLLEKMEESDRRTEALIQEHLTHTRKLLSELADIDKKSTM